MNTQTERQKRQDMEAVITQEVQASSPRSLLDRVHLRFVWGPGGLTKVEIRRRLKTASERGGDAPSGASATS